MNLYELAREFENFEFEFDEDGVVTNEDELEAIEMDFNTKMINCIKFYKNKVAEAESLKAEKMKLAERQKSAERQAENIKKWISLCLKGNKWHSSDNVFKVSYRKSEQVEIRDDAILPDQYVEYVPKLDKAGIKKAVKDGAEFRGVSLVEVVNTQIV